MTHLPLNNQRRLYTALSKRSQNNIRKYLPNNINLAENFCRVCGKNSNLPYKCTRCRGLRPNQIYTRRYQCTPMTPLQLTKIHQMLKNLGKGVKRVKRKSPTRKARNNARRLGI